MSMTPASSQSVAIIGMECLFPQAENVQAYWANIQAGVDAIKETPASHWDVNDYYHDDPSIPDHTYGRRGGFLDPVPFPPLEFGVTPKSLEATDTTQLLGLLVARRTLEQAGYGAEREFDRNRVSVILGVTGTLPLVIPLGARLGHPIWRRALQNAGVPNEIAEKVIQEIGEGYVGWQEDSFPGLLGNVVAGRIANRLNLGGTNCVVDAACASSLSAMHLSLLELQAGRCDMVLSGGIDTFNDIFMYMCFSKTPALSPTGDAKPFSAAADGTILGEGVGCLLLKRLADAERDGDKIIAVLRAMGTSSDGKGRAIYAPSSSGQTKALRRAYEESNIAPPTIELVEAHGTGTKAGDAAEVAALTEVYRAAKSDGSWCALGSVKSQIGHTKAAAGAAGIIKAALALQHKVVPPTIKIDQPIEALTPGQSPFYLSCEKRPWLPHDEHPRRAGVSSFGFGGSNFHCVLEEYASEKETIDWDGRVQIVAFSGQMREELQHKIASWFNIEGWEHKRREAAISRIQFRSGDPHRLVMVAFPDQDETRLQQQIETKIAQSKELSWSLPDGVWYATGDKPGLLALLFPGQGSQYTGMGRDAACQFPHMLNALTQANRIFQAERPKDQRRLSDLIFPYSAFTEDEAKQQESALRATEVAQPGLGAIGLGLLHVLRHFGVTANAVAGHSFGELTALHAAGRLTESELLHLACIRGRLMAETSGGNGGMIAVQLSAQEVADWLKREGVNLVVANQNSPRQTVVSGADDEIKRGAGIMRQQKIAHHPLPVGAAFHSAAVADMTDSFHVALDSTSFPSSWIPVYANSTASPYPADANQCRKLLARQPAEPVRFLEMIQNMYESGVRTFVEVGPGAALTGLTHSILQDKQHVGLSLDGSRGKQSGQRDLALALGQIAALGYSVDLSRWDELGNELIAVETSVSPLTVPICGANYRNPRPETSKTTNSANGKAKSIATHQPDSQPMNQSSNGAPTKSCSIIDSKTQPDRGEEPQKPSRSVDACANPPVHSVDKSHVEKKTVNESLENSEDTLLALQKITEQTAELHRRFLEGQDRALQVLQAFVDQSQAPSSIVRRPHEQQAEPLPIASTPAPKPVQTPSAAVPPVVAKTLPPIEPIQKPEPNDKTTPILLEIVADKTGYPVEMLELDMEMDGDLGIDSIKRVEIFSALQENLTDAPPIQSEQLGELRTLRDVANYLQPIAPEPVAGPTVAAPVNGAVSSETARMLLDIVADKTGYPVDMLQLEMEMDADLGIDSIKRVEIFSAVQEHMPNAPAIESEHLGNLRTLQEVVAFLQPSAAAPKSPVATSGPSPVAAPPVNSRPSSVLQHQLLGIVADKTGYPPEMLEIGMEMDADLGIDSIKRVEIFSALQEQLPQLPAIESEHLGSLRTLQDVLTFLQGEEAAATAAPAKTTLPAVPSLDRYVVSAAPLHSPNSRRKLNLSAHADVLIITEPTELACGIGDRFNLLGYRARHVTAREILDGPITGPIAGVIFLAPPSGVTDEYFSDSFQVTQKLSVQMRRGNRSDCVLMTVSRLDGRFGLSQKANLSDALSGGMAGLAKTAAWEWPDVHCKAVDLSPQLDDEESALAVCSEFFLAGPVEVGVTPEGIWQTQLEKSPLTGDSHIPLAKDDVVLVTGGARGVTAATALALARAGASTLILMGRSPAPQQEPDWLQPLREEAAIKQALIARAPGRVSPREITNQLREINAGREIRWTLERLNETGAVVEYRQLDVRNAAAVEEICADVRDKYGPISGLVHGAGVLADKRIEDKTLEQFQSVYETKVVGLRNLLSALSNDPLKVIALFSSSSGRFGRAGQIDYAIANEILNKMAQAESRHRSDCRVCAVNWGPWEGGMVDPGLKKLFQSEGLQMIPLEDGANFVVYEIGRRDNSSVEIVVLGQGSKFPQVAEIGKSNGRFDDANGRQASDVRSNGTQQIHNSVIGSQNHANGSAMSPAAAFTRKISVARQPALQSHVIGGKAVVPVVLMIEWFAHAALHGNPGLQFHGFDDLRIFRGIKLDETEECDAEIRAGKAIKKDNFFVVPVELHSQNKLGEFALNAGCSMLLATHGATAPMPLPALPRSTPAVSVAEAYESQLFHGPDFQGLIEILGISPDGAAAKVLPSPAPKEWLQQPLRQHWLTDPLVIDSAFQLMVLWTWQHYNLPSLPSSLAKYRQYRRTMPKGEVCVVAHVTKRSPQQVRADIDILDSQAAVAARISGYECIIDQSLIQSYQQKHLASAAVAFR